MTTHAVIFFDYPPAVLNILAPRVLRIVEQRRGYVRSFGPDTAQKNRRQSGTPLLSQIRLGHAELVFALQILRLARVVDLRLGQSQGQREVTGAARPVPRRRDRSR